MARILLIEPNRVLARQYRAALQAEGHEVVSCLTGQAAIQAADRTTPDMVILELQLAHHNGVEFLYEFRSYADWQDVPVMVLSSVPAETFKGAAALPLLNISRYLYKPAFNLRQICEAVEELTQPAFI